MYDFISSIGNIIGEYLNKLIDLCFGEKKEKIKPSIDVKLVDLSKPSTWTRKKK
ncbi:MAG: hypothetical protein AAB484_00465 [Patescibacteria group bacterium]